MAQKPLSLSLSLSAQIHPGVGFRIKTDMPRPRRKLVDSFREFDSPDIFDQLNRLYGLVPEIYCLAGPKHKLVGPVCTVKVCPGDNLMVRKALDVANPGDIIAVDARASRTNAVIGGLISMKAKARKIAGFIVDGFIRDLPEIMARLIANRARNQKYLADVSRGDFSNEWVDDLLTSSDCVVIGDPGRRERMTPARQGIRKQPRWRRVNRLGASRDSRSAVFGNCSG